MMSYQYFQKIQPIGYTGILAHCFMWALASLSDIIYTNPEVSSIIEKKEKEGKSVSVYCIHGTADRVSAFKLLASRLLPHLPKGVDSINLVSFNGRLQGLSIEEFAEQLLQKIQQKNDTEIILLGHSRGGLIAAYFTEYLAKAAGINVHAVITIGTPFQGSYMAVAPLTWFSKSIYEMQVNSEFLQALNKKMDLSSTKYFYFVAENDAIVDPKSAYGRKDSWTLNLLPRHGHLSILSSHNLVSYIKDIFNNISKEFPIPISNVLIPKKINKLDPFLEFPMAIDNEIKAIKSRTHIVSPDEKISLLKELKIRFYQKVEEGNPDKETIGKFVESFMQDKNADGVTRWEIINKPLNYPFNFFMPSKSGGTLKNLMTAYQDVDIPTLDITPYTDPNLAPQKI